MLLDELAKDETDFNDWLNSIEFVNEESRIIPAVLEDDDSDDPEGDKRSN